jgi:pimeloyl-ACP methyl ester carboxylesterase
MPKLFVHGNPETSVVWAPLVDALAARGVTDVELLSPPGFGAPVPAGFGCTQPEYRDWLIDTIAAADEPVDLVGHDWGAGHVYAAVAARPDLVRSWAADCAGLAHPDYVWHDGAQVWQTPEAGEQLAEAMIGLPPEALGAWGAPPGLAPALAAGIDATMTAAMLPLYRSAVQPALRELGQQLLAAERRPGLVIDAVADPYVPSDLSRQMAASLGAEVVTLDGAAHWWMWEATDQAADALVEFWSAPT